MIPLPNITWAAFGVGVGVLLVGVALAWLVRRMVAAILRWRGRSASSAQVFGGVSQTTLIILAFGAAMTVIFPSVKPVDVLGGIGIVSIAAGIAFQTVLGNIFAGMVILGRDRFKVGDQIRVGDHQGTVTSMRLSSTAIRTFDGRLLLVPNSSLHSEIVAVQTGYEQVRSSVILDLDEATDLDVACRTAMESMRLVPEVLDDPEPQALLTAVGTATIQLELLFWSGARQLETREARHAVIRQVMRDFARVGVMTGSDIQVIEAGPRLAGQLGWSDATPDHSPRAVEVKGDSNKLWHEPRF